MSKVHSVNLIPEIYISTQLYWIERNHRARYGTISSMFLFSFALIPCIKHFLHFSLWLVKYYIKSLSFSLPHSLSQEMTLSRLLVSWFRHQYLLAFLHFHYIKVENYLTAFYFGKIPQPNNNTEQNQNTAQRQRNII